MNERIKELLLQATTLKGPFIRFKVDQEKFAELIVQECIALAVKEEERYDSLGGRDSGYCSMAMSNFQERLTEHFKVEE